MSKASTIVNLIHVVDLATRNFAANGTTYPDANTTPAFGSICEGLSLLLNESLDHYDGGTLSAWIEDIAERVHWSMDESEIDYGHHGAGV